MKQGQVRTLVWSILDPSLRVQSDFLSMLSIIHFQYLKANNEPSTSKGACEFVILLLFSHQVTSDSFMTPWTVAPQGPLSMGFPRQEYWCGLPFPSPGDLPHPGTEPESSTFAGRFFTAEPPGQPLNIFREL